MAILDFPASPTVGQVVTLTNGYSYTWDGNVWTLTAATGQTAGGDLTGTYPNPTIAPLAVTTGKLAVGATVARQVGVANSMAAGTIASGTEATIATVSAQTYRGGFVVILFDLSIRTYLTDDSTLVLRLYQDSTLLQARNCRGGTTNLIQAVGYAMMGCTQPAAGTHDISARWVRALGLSNWEMVNANLQIIELG